MLVNKPKEEKLTKPLEPETPEDIPILEPEKTRMSNMFDDVNFIQVVSSAPSDPPNTPLEGIKLHISGGTTDLYIWDRVNNTWRTVAVT